MRSGAASFAPSEAPRPKPEAAADADAEQRARLLEPEVIRGDAELRDDDAAFRQRVVHALADVRVANRLFATRSLDGCGELRRFERLELGDDGPAAVGRRALRRPGFQCVVEQLQRRRVSCR